MYLLRMKFIGIFGIFFVLLSFSLSAQKPGTWKVHLPFTDVKSISSNSKEVFAGTPSGIFILSLEGEPIEILNSLNGLSDNDVRKLHWSEEHKALLVAYENGQLDWIKGQKIQYWNAIYKAPIIGKKQINDIYFKDNDAWIACSFGIVRQDVSQLARSETYRNLGPGGASVDVSGVMVHQDTIYATTNLGILQAPLNATNLSDFRFWNLIKSSSSCHKIIAFRQELFVGMDSAVYKYSQGSWQIVPSSSHGKLLDMAVSDDFLTMTFEKAIIVYNGASGQSTVYPEVGQREAIYLPKHGLFSASFFAGIIWKTISGNTWYVYPNGPNSKFCTDIQFYQNKCFVATGGMSPNWDSYYRNDRFSWYDGKEWNSYTQLDPQLLNVRDIWKIAIDPLNGSVYLASFGNGMLHFDGNSITEVFNASNSSLDSFNSGGFKRLYVGGMVFDESRNLWISNPGSAFPLKRMTFDKKWFEYPIPGLSVNDVLTDIVIDDWGQKWILAPRGRGLVVYNDNKTWDIIADDQYKILNGDVGNGALLDLNVNCMVKDHDGALWVGHQSGLQVFYSPSLIFSNQNFDGQRIITSENGKPAYLFNKEPILSMAVDAGNRKWVGTTKGVFLISPDGKKTIRYFNQDNSPLISNFIQRISIHPISGEVFFATDKGIVSVQGDAVNAKEDLNELEIYPNPVKPEFTGDIVFRGLMEKTSVKITDMAGNLVFATESNGGMAIWNGLTFEGKRPTSGVYLIICSSADGIITRTGKLAIISN